jgi:hypothetical protein
MRCTSISCGIDDLAGRLPHRLILGVGPESTLSLIARHAPMMNEKKAHERVNPLDDLEATRTRVNETGVSR